MSRLSVSCPFRPLTVEVLCFSSVFGVVLLGVVLFVGGGCVLDFSCRMSWRLWRRIVMTARMSAMSRKSWCLRPARFCVRRGRGVDIAFGGVCRALFKFMGTIWGQRFAI